MKTCEKCGGEYDDALATCPKCAAAGEGQKPGPTAHDQWMMLFAILAAVSGALHVIRPATSMTHLAFRLSLTGVAVVGFLVVLMLKLNRGR